MRSRRVRLVLARDVRVAGPGRRLQLDDRALVALCHRFRSFPEWGSERAGAPGSSCGRAIVGGRGVWPNSRRMRPGGAGGGAAAASPVGPSLPVRCRSYRSCGSDRARPHSRARAVVVALIPARRRGVGPRRAVLVEPIRPTGPSSTRRPTPSPCSSPRACRCGPDGVRVLDAQGRTGRHGRGIGSGSDVSVPVEGTLADGTYVVSWRVVSADGHPIRGTFTFSVGEETQVGGRGGRQGVRERQRPRLRAARRRAAGPGLHRRPRRRRLRPRRQRPAAAADPSPVGRRTTVAAVHRPGRDPAPGAAPGRARHRAGPRRPSPTPRCCALADRRRHGPAALVTGVGLLAIIITAGPPWEGAARKVALAGAAIAPVGLRGHRPHPHDVAGRGRLPRRPGPRRWPRPSGSAASSPLIGPSAAAGLSDDPQGAAEAVAGFSGWARRHRWRCSSWPGSP